MTVENAKRREIWKEGQRRERISLSREEKKSLSNLILVEEK